MTPEESGGSRLFCSRCGREESDRSVRIVCPACKSLFELRHPDPPARGTALRELFESRRRDGSGLEASGVWRYRELVLPRGAADAVTHPEGNTPLLERSVVTSFTGVSELRLKHEGHNPTGSFKDRGMTVGITQARRIGARAAGCASTGNTAASLAAYAAQAGIPALVFVPAGYVAAGKLAQSLAYGARTLIVRGDFDLCFSLVREAAETLGIYLLNSVNPFRLEGQKTILLEALEQLGWNAPDWIALPAGNLGNTSAFGRALVEARALGLISRVPRLAAIQAAGANPFARSFREGFARPHRVTADTVATAIRIGDPASFRRAVEAIHATDGVVIDVTDEEILEAKAVIDASGVGCEPASAASVAGVRKLVQEGIIGEGDRVVAVLTGHLLKDPGILLAYHRDTRPPPARANRPIEIEPTLAAVEEVLTGEHR